MEDNKLKINSKDKLAGQPILIIRDFLRYVQSMQFWWIGLLKNKLKISDKAAKEIVKVLLDENYIKEAERFRNEKTWVNTIKGNSLAMASAAVPIHRKTAGRLLKEFMERVNYVNENDNYAYKVIKVIIFGSYLSDNERLNDIDIAIELAPKEKDENKQRQKEQERVLNAVKNGRSFSSYCDQIFWPSVEVLLFLKNHSRSISLHNINDGVLSTVNYQVVFEQG